MPGNISKAIGILGGTFDPIHHGHLRLAVEACETLSLDHLRFIPLKSPVHRDDTKATAQQRSAMIELAIEGQTNLVLDQREIHRATASYTIETLKSLRTDFPDVAICLLMGKDSFSTLDTWKDWQQLLDYAHIIVASRHQPDNTDLNSAIQRIINSHETQSVKHLHETINGFIYRMTMPLLDISASGIRHKKHSNHSLRYLLPENVINYIHTENLYE